MSSGVRQKIRLFICNKEKRDSFDVRFCDELCADILQYLPIEHKLKFECLSQQIQRTIYERHHKLEIPEYLIKYYSDNAVKFQYLLEKCPNIVEIDFPFAVKRWLAQGYYPTEYRNIIEMIVMYCHHLTRITINFSKLSPKINETLIERFASKLCAIDTTEDNFLSNTFIDVFGNLKEFHLKENSTTFWYFAIKSVRHLEKLVIKNSVDLEGLAHFIARNPALKYLSIEVSSKDINQTASLLDQISKLKKLMHFEFKSNFELNNNFLETEIYRMAVMCRQLKSIDCNIVFDSSMTFSPNKGFFLVLTQFRQLKRLKILVSIKEITFPIINEIISIKAFNQLKKLTHLTINFNINDRYGNGLSLFVLHQTFLTNIDIYLPKLQYLEINRNMTANLQIVNILRLLSSLETIKLLVTEPSIRSIIVSRLLNKCPKIKYIYVGDIPISGNHEAEDESDDEYEGWAEVNNNYY